MGKKKGKQKQDESAINNQTQSSTVEQHVVPGDMNANNFVETNDNTWGSTAQDAWDTNPNPEPQADTWAAEQDTETWDNAESLLQPPSTKELPTIHEQLPSGRFPQNRARLSEIEESPDEYDHYSESNSVPHSESKTVTAAALSFTGSPTTAPPVQSTSVLQEAMKAILTQGTSTASEAARKMEKAKVVQFNEPVNTAKVEKSSPQPAPRHGLSSASAAAAAAESSKKQAHVPNPGQKASNSNTIPWTYPKAFRPGAREPVPIPIDPSWISTGGNAWSNKHRQNSSWSPGSEYLRARYQFQLQSQQFQRQSQFQQHAQHTQQVRQSHRAQQPQVHKRHYSQPTQPQTHHSQSIRPIYKIQTKERQDWRHWGKEQWDQSNETESDNETATGWETLNQHEGNQLGRSGGEAWGQNQNANWGEWGQGAAGGRAQNGWEAREGRNQDAGGGLGQNPGEGRGQHIGAGWDQSAAKGWDQSAAEGWGTGETWGQGVGGWAQEPTNPTKDDRKYKSHPKKAGDEWGQGGDAWSQGHEISGQKQQGNWRAGANEARGQDAWANHHQGGRGRDAWGQGVSTWAQDTKRQSGQGASTWDQDTNHRGGQGADAWTQGRAQDTKNQGGQGADEWGQGASAWAQDTKNQGDQGADAWGQGASAWAQDTKNQSGQADAWGQGASTWAQDTGDNRKLAGEWAAGGASSHTAWQDEGQRLPKVTPAAASEAVGNRNVLSAQQRSQILNNLLNETQPQNVKVARSTVKHDAQKKAGHERWGTWEAYDDGWGSEDEDDIDDTRRVRFSPKTSLLWGESPRSIPSKTLARAQQGMTTPVNDPDSVYFLESKGAAFEYVTAAFFGNTRLARERIHWLFPSDKDPRVAGMLAWVQKLSFNMGTFGLIKFLQHKERGGLFINAIFRMRHNAKEPAIDWLTFNQLQGTMDKTLQESVAFYDPSAQVMVFVYLPSESGNSIAIWRVKINVPEKTRLKYRAEINAMVKILPKHTEYSVYVDERPPKKKAVQKTGLLRKTRHDLPALPAKPKEKRKWWQIFRFF